MSVTFEPTDPNYAATVAAAFAHQRFLTLNGARLIAIAPGRVVIELPPHAQFLQHHGRIHGGVVGALADSAGGLAALTLMPAGADVLTIEYKINFMRAAIGTLRATGEVIRPGKTITVTRMVCSCEVDGVWETCAVVQATFMRVEASPSPC
jgi:uncharacterized protein (TIGR00369 family)